MFYLISKTGKNILAWSDSAPSIKDATTQEIIEIQGLVPPGFKGLESKIVSGQILNLTSGEKTATSQARQSKLDSYKYAAFKAIVQDNLADLKSLLGIT